MFCWHLALSTSRERRNSGGRVQAVTQRKRSDDSAVLVQGCRKHDMANSTNGQVWTGIGSKSEILRFFFLINYQQKYGMEPLFKGLKMCENSVRVWGRRKCTYLIYVISRFTLITRFHVGAIADHDKDQYWRMSTMECCKGRCPPPNQMKRLFLCHSGVFPVWMYMSPGLKIVNPSLSCFRFHSSWVWSWSVF